MVGKDSNDYGFLHCHVKCGMTEEIIVLICSTAFEISSRSDKQFRKRHAVIVFLKFSLKRVS